MAISHITTECKRYGCMKNLLACYANCRFTTRCDELRNEIIEKPEQATTDINAYLGERGMRLIQIQFPKRGVKFIEAGKQASEPRSARSLLKVAKNDAPPAPAPISSVPASPVPVSKEPRPRPRRRLKARLKAASKAVAEEKAEAKAETPEAVSRRPRKEASVVKPSAVKPSVKPPAKPAASGKSKARRKKAARKVESRKAMDQDRAMSEQVTEKEKSVKSKKVSSNKRNSAPAARSARKQGKKFIILEGKSASLVDEQGLMMHIMSGSSPEARYFEVNEVEARVQIVSKK